MQCACSGGACSEDTCNEDACRPGPRTHAMPRAATPSVTCARRQSAASPPRAVGASPRTRPQVQGVRRPAPRPPARWLSSDRCMCTRICTCHLCTCHLCICTYAYAPIHMHLLVDRVPMEHGGERIGEEVCVVVVLLSTHGRDTHAELCHLATGIGRGG
jgi:hypothetical protein